jgi:hypothetical protein
LVVGAAASDGNRLRGLRVLYVDDEDVNRNVGRRMLDRLGCTPLLLTDGSEVEPALNSGMQVRGALLSPCHAGGCSLPPRKPPTHA